MRCPWRSRTSCQPQSELLGLGRVMWWEKPVGSLGDTQQGFELDASLVWSRKPVAVAKLGVVSFPGEKAGSRV